ncbi:MAG TPA: O-antigen ligase family protein, partial [Byssovorax sp.]
MSAGARRRGGALLAVGASAAALVFDPAAEAAASKRVALLAVALVALAASLASHGRERRAPPRAHAAAVAFVAVSAASLAYGAPGGALDLATWTAALGLGAVLTSLGRATAIRAARLAASLTGGGASIAAIVALARGGRGFALHGLQGNPNWLGLLLAVCLPLSIDALRRPPIELLARRRRAPVHVARAALTGVVACEVVGLALAHSRVAWCATLAGGVAALALELHARRRAGRPIARVVALAGVVAITSLGAAAALERAPAISADVSAATSLDGRAWIAARSLEAAAARAPFGAGLGRFGHAYLDAQGRALAELSPADAARRFVNATTAHDDLVQAAVESGLVAAVALAALLSLAAYGHVAGSWGAGAASAVALVIAAIGDSPLRQPGVVVVFSLACAALPRARARRPRSGAPIYAALLAC